MHMKKLAINESESLLIVDARERIRELEWAVEQHKDNALALQQRIRELESQSVPVVGEPVGFILLHENGGKNLTFHDNTGKLSDGWSQHKLVIHPTTPHPSPPPNSPPCIICNN